MMTPPVRDLSSHWLLAFVAVTIQIWQVRQVYILDCPCGGPADKIDLAHSGSASARQLLNKVAALQGRPLPFSIEPERPRPPPVATERPRPPPPVAAERPRATQAAASQAAPQQQPAVLPPPRNNGAAPPTPADVQRQNFSILDFLMSRHPRGIGIILGVGRNPFALDLLQNWHTSPGLYLVDPFVHIHQGYDEPENLSDWDHQRVFEDLRNKIHRFEGRHSLMRDFSQSFAITWQNNPMQQPPPPLSLVYVDNNPAHEAVLRDLTDWWRSLGPGGIIAGPNWHKAGIQSAVLEFSGMIRLPIQLFQDGDTWFLQNQ